MREEAAEEENTRAGLSDSLPAMLSGVVSVE